MSDLDGVSTGCVPVDKLVAVEFGDLDQHQDRAGRLIPHGFVLCNELVETVEDGLRETWPLVADYSEAWDLPGAPSPARCKT